MPDRIVILTEGHSNPLTAKTACSVIRYRRGDVVAVLDSTQAGKRAGELLGVGDDLPVIASLEDATDANVLLLGIATQGGQFPDDWRRVIKQALHLGMDVTSGLHDFLCDDPEIRMLAEELGRTLTDVRKNEFRSVSNRKNLRADCLRIHTVGHDCNVGKMVTSLEIARGLQRQGKDAKFVATGQTGILIEGDGCPIDCVVSDFVNGAAEQLVLDHQHHEILVIEGQGSLAHPRYSAVTAGLLHGCVPHGLILCYQPGRETFNTMDHCRIPVLSEIKQVYEVMANLAAPCQVLGIAMNSYKLTAAEADAERQRIRSQFGLPVCDVIRDGSEELVQAVLEYHQSPGWRSTEACS